MDIDLSLFRAEIRELALALERLRTSDECQAAIESIGGLLVDAAKNGKSVYVCGNGGSAAQASHFVGELLGRFRDERQPVSASALNDPAVLTCILNDYGPEAVFERQLQGLIKPGDVVVFLTTSGRSRNILKAAESIAKGGTVATMAAVTGSRKTELHSLVDVSLSLPAVPTAVVQELTLKVIHFWCGMVDAALEA